MSGRKKLPSWVSGVIEGGGETTQPCKLQHNFLWDTNITCNPKTCNENLKILIEFRKKLFSFLEKVVWGRGFFRKQIIKIKFFAKLEEREYEKTKPRIAKLYSSLTCGFAKSLLGELDAFIEIIEGCETRKK